MVTATHPNNISIAQANLGLHKASLTGPDLSRREICQRLGLMGVAMLLGGCQGFPLPSDYECRGDPTSDLAAFNPEQFAEKVGTVERARENAVNGSEPLSAFMERFLAYSPRIRAASQQGGIIGSVFYNPRPEVLASAVKLQLSRGRREPELLHDDLAAIAAAQYSRVRQRAFAAIFPNVVTLIGDGIHKDRALLQLVIVGGLPSEKIVRTNEDLESLIGRQLTLASQMVHGICYPGETTPIRWTMIQVDNDDRTIPDGAISVRLADELMRLEATIEEVKVITPADPGEPPRGWQKVSDSYRAFAVGQADEVTEAVAGYVPHNTFEKTIVTATSAVYRSYLGRVKQQLGWDHTHDGKYRFQKHDYRVDLMARPVLLLQRLENGL